jgi:hypothetical protein
MKIAVRSVFDVKIISCQNIKLMRTKKKSPRSREKIANREVGKVKMGMKKMSKKFHIFH